MTGLEGNLSDEIKERIEELARVILESPEFVAFERARKNLEESKEAQKLIREFQDKQRHFQIFGGFGNPTAQTELEKCQERMMANLEIQDYLKKQEELAEFFREIGRIISENADLDFIRACTPLTGCYG